MFVPIDDERRALALRYLHWEKLRVEESASDSGASALLAPKREAVLVLSRNAKGGSHVLARLRHRVRPVERLHFGIHEAPADGGIENLGLAAEGGVGLGHHERRSR